MASKEKFVSPETAAEMSFRNSAVENLTMISLLCSCIETWRTAKTEKTERVMTVRMAQTPAATSHAGKYTKGRSLQIPRDLSTCTIPEGSNIVFPPQYE